MYHDVIAQICKKYGKAYTKEIKSRMIGGTDRHICEQVVKELKIDVSVDKFEAELLQLSEELLPKAPLQKGVERLLFHLRDNEIPVALATNSTASQVRLHANSKPQIFNIFNHVVTATDSGVRRGKPFPDLYLAAAEKFPKRPQPSECLVFEDSLVGLQAGLSAGMQVILTPHQNLDPAIASQATMVLNNLLDFRPELFGLPPFKEREKPNVLQHPTQQQYSTQPQCPNEQKCPSQPQCPSQRQRPNQLQNQIQPQCPSQQQNPSQAQGYNPDSTCDPCCPPCSQCFSPKPQLVQCLVFGDSRVGLNASLLAGMQVRQNPSQQQYSTQNQCPNEQKCPNQPQCPSQPQNSCQPQGFTPPDSAYDPCCPRCSQCIPPKPHQVQVSQCPTEPNCPNELQSRTPPQCPDQPQGFHPQGFKPPASAYDPCSLCRRSSCPKFNPPTSSKNSFDLRSIIKNKIVLMTLLIGIYSGIIYRLW